MVSTTTNTEIAKFSTSKKVLRDLRVRRVLRGFVVLASLLFGGEAHAQDPPQLIQPVNDFAGVIDSASAAQMDALIRSLQEASGDVVVVATVKTFQPYADIGEYAVKMFENGGRGVGQRGRDNGLLVLLALDDRQVRVEVGYDLEEFITDGFAGETSRRYMTPEFRQGDYGAGLSAGVSRIVERIAERRNVTLQGVPRDPAARAPDAGSGGNILFALFVLFIVINALAGRTRRRRRFRGGWGGPAIWTSGVGPFGGGFGGRGGGGFGGGFGGFGGGRSGGGGGGASW